jgi:hypothetical protein
MVTNKTITNPGTNLPIKMLIWFQDLTKYQQQSYKIISKKPEHFSLIKYEYFLVAQNTLHD